MVALAKSNLPRKALFIGILSILLSSGGEYLYGQNFPERMWWTPGLVSSLPVVDSLQNSNGSNLLGLDFQHTLSLFSWSSSLRLASNSFFASARLSPSFSVSSEARSRLREDTRVRTNEANAFINADYPLDAFRNGLTFSFFGTTYSLRSPADQAVTQIGTLANVTDGYGVIGGKYFPVPTTEITVGAGAARKSFEIGTSSGWIVKGGAVESPVQLSEGNSLDSTTLAIDERHFTLADEVARNDNVHARLLTSFSDNGSNDASAGIYLKRRDFFFPKDTSGALAKQERSETGFEFHDALYFPLIAKRLIGNFRADISPHQVTRRTPSVDITTLPTTTLTTSTFLVPSSTSALEAGLAGRLDLLIGENPDTSRLTELSAEMKFDDKSETNNILQGETGSLSALEVQKLSDALSQTGYEGKQTTLNLSAYIPIAEHDRINADFSSRIYRYDTQSPDNHDTRDELNLSSSLQYDHMFSHELELKNELRLAESHLVYLASDRSLQNYVSKTIALSSQAIYYSASFQHQVRCEVFANYSVYDFPPPVIDPGSIRDYLIRGVNGSDSVRLSLGKFHVIWDALSTIEGIFDVRFYERGAYNRSAFTELPVLRTQEFSGDLTLNLTDRISSSPMLVKIGARAFFLRRYEPPSTLQTNLVLQESLNRIGPLLIVIIDQLAIKGPRLFGSIWYSLVQQNEFDTNIFSSSHQIEGRLTAQWTF
jgi:hypothetical protein